ncbi:MAG TPA: hypothetical protein VHE10_02195 [Candidatus Paceibacterota bacterium]|nr:hypothetical protein [Candidatus Paceibacterota bacterium]
MIKVEFDKGRGFNPHVSDFLDAHKEMTLLGLAWALFWRFSVAYGAIGIIFATLSNILGW